MTHARARSLLPAVVTLATALVACDALWPLDSRYDPRRCDPACGEGRQCIDGECAGPDGGTVADAAPVRDTALDAARLPYGERCANGSDCESGMCGGGFCSARCSAAQPCPNDDPCVTAGSAQVCDPRPRIPGTWVTIPAGTFMMGSPTSEPCRGSDEDQHQVTLTRSFEIQTTEVTQGQFQGLLGYNPSSFSSCGTTCPVEGVNWHEAVAYCNALSAQQGLGQCYTCTGSGAGVTCQDSYVGSSIYTCPGYRLPTEAEWEYAYRAGTTGAYYSGPNDPNACYCQGDANLSSIAWYCGNSGSKTHPVAQKQANAWGLFDMAGNVWEWCHDWYQNSLGSSAVTDPVGSGSTSRVIRGGSWYGLANGARAANRNPYTPSNRVNSLGFRCLRTK